MTAVPAAFDGVLAILKATPALAKVLIIDEPWVDRPSAKDVIVIGWLPEETGIVDWTEDLAGLGSYSETFDIQGLVSSFSGSTTLKPLRDRCDFLLETVRAAVHAHPTLNGAVSKARVVAQRMSLFENNMGAAVDTDFTIRCQVF